MVTINETEYRTKTSLIQACRDLTNSLPNISSTPRLIPPDQRAFWDSLMAFNCRTAIKITELPGTYAGFGYQQNPDKSYRIEAQIGVMDDRGTFLSLSWHNAVNEAFNPGISQSRAQLVSDIKFGFRRAIMPQIDEERRKRLKDGRIQCEATGEWCEPRDIHIDHHPIGFDFLANQFLDCLEEDCGMRLNFDMIHRTHMDDPLHCRFKDEALDTAWRVWHREVAQLRAVTAAVNLSKAR